MPTKIVGVLNITPDSFQTVSRHLDPQAAFDRLWQMIDEGADMIDVGAESSRPSTHYGSQTPVVSAVEEMDRLKPFLGLLKNKSIPVPLSIDTIKPEVARLCLDHGFAYVNDISGLENPEMRQIISQAGAGAIIMHKQGQPQTMEDNPSYNNVVQEVYGYLKHQANLAQKEGINDIILDPGIGFGKTLDHNLAILKNIRSFQDLGFPVLVGPSRKHFIGVLTGGLPPEDRLEGTLVSAAYLASQQIDWIRVHDVQACHRALTVAEALWK